MKGLLFVGMLRCFPRVGKMRSLFTRTYFVEAYGSHTLQRSLYGFHSRLAPFTQKCYFFFSSLPSQHCSDVSAYSSVRTETVDCQTLLDNGSLLQFRKPEDDWLHWGILVCVDIVIYSFLKVTIRIFSFLRRRTNIVYCR